MINVAAPAAAAAPAATNISTGSVAPATSSTPVTPSQMAPDYSLFSGSQMGGAGDSGGGAGGGVGGNAGDAAAAAAAGTGDGFAKGGPIYRDIPSPDYQNRKMAEYLSRQGRGRDTTLVHMSKPEVMGLGSLHPSGRMPINPKTGLPEADFLSDVLPGLAGTVIGSFAGMPWLGAALGGLGTWAATGNLGKGILSGLMSFGLGELGSELGSAGVEAKAAEDVSKLPQFPTTSDVGYGAANPAASAPQGIMDKVSQNIGNIPNQISNIGTGLVNPQNWNLSKMLMPAAITGGALYGMNQMGQQGNAPTPQMPQQAPPPPLTTGAVPPRLPTGATPPPGYGTSEAPRETTFFQPNPAWSGYPSYAATGGPVTAYATGGGVMHDGATYNLAEGGLSNLPSGLIRGPGGGMDDKVKGSIDGRRDVYLSDGEYVIDAQTVSALGDGSTEAGAKRLKHMVDEVRQKKFGSKKQPAKMASMGGIASLHLAGGSEGDVDYGPERVPATGDDWEFAQSAPGGGINYYKRGPGYGKKELAKAREELEYLNQLTRRNAPWFLNEKLVGKGLPYNDESVLGGAARAISQATIGQPYGYALPPRERDFAEKRRKLEDAMIEAREPGWEDILRKRYPNK